MRLSGPLGRVLNGKLYLLSGMYIKELGGAALAEGYFQITTAADKSEKTFSIGMVGAQAENGVPGNVDSGSLSG